MLATDSPILVKPCPLNYAAGDTLAEESFRRRLLTVILSLPSLIVPFVSFTYDTSPAYAIKTVLYEQLIEHSREEYHWLMVLATGLSWPLVVWVWEARSLLPLRVRNVERIILICLAALLAASGIAFTYMGIVEKIQNANSVDTYEFVSFISCPTILLAGGTLLIIFRRSILPRRFARLVNLVAYLSVAVMALLGFAERRDPGWWITICLCCAALIEIAMTLVNPFAALRWILPINDPRSLADVE